MKTTAEHRLKIAEMRREGLGTVAIVKKTGLSRSCVWKLTKEMGILVDKRIWTDEETQFLKQNWGKITARQISVKLDRKMHSIYLKANRLGLTGKRIPEKKPSNWREIIQEKAAAGWTQTETSEVLGISRRYTGQLALQIGVRFPGHYGDGSSNQGKH